MLQAYLFTSFLLLIPLLFLLQFFKRNSTIESQNLPPSPPKLPIIGNLHQLGSQPHLSLCALANIYGPIIHLQLGHVPTIVISSPEMAKQVMKYQDTNFANRPHSEVAMLLHRGSYDIAFAPYGEYWRQTRKLCITHLLSAKMVQSFRHVKEEEVETMLNKISQLTSLHGVVNMSEVFDVFSSSVMSRAVSTKFSRDDKKHTLRKLTKENSEILAAFHVADYFPVFGWLDISGLYSKAKNIASIWNDILDEVVGEQAKHLSDKNDVTHKSKDFVDVLLSLENDKDYSFTRNQLKAILIDMFAAGIETSYTVLEYTMAELIRKPEVMEKLQTEVRGVAKGKNIIREDDLSKMSYLKVVIKEAMRLHPPVPLLLPRESVEACELSGYQIPKKTRVVVNVWAIGRDPDIWEKPDEFMPERFINNSIDFKGSDFEFTPFGSGRRICPGMNFATQSVELGLANVVNKFNWALPSDKNGLNMNDCFGLVTRMAERLDLVATEVQIGNTRIKGY